MKNSITGTMYAGLMKDYRERETALVKARAEIQRLKADLQMTSMRLQNLQETLDVLYTD